MAVRFAYGFEIRRSARGFYLIDRDTFNNWGELYGEQPLATSEAAAEYARECHNKKRAPASA